MRRHRTKISAGTLATISLILGFGLSGTAQAASLSAPHRITSITPAATVGLCHDTKYGGTFWCFNNNPSTGESKWIYTDGSWSLFVVGPDSSTGNNVVYEKSGISNGTAVTGWVNLGGAVELQQAGPSVVLCLGSPLGDCPGGSVQDGSGNNTPTIVVQNSNNLALYYRSRSATGVWGAWTPLPGQ